MESLSVARDKYKSLEKRLTKFFFVIVVILFTICIIFIAIFVLTKTTPWILAQITDLYFLGLTVFTLSIYNSSTLGLMYHMYCDHRMAFHRHIKF